jgi:hypothetical protein
MNVAMLETVVCRSEGTHVEFHRSRAWASWQAGLWRAYLAAKRFHPEEAIGRSRERRRPTAARPETSCEVAPGVLKWNG